MLSAFFHPKSIAVVGASREPQKVGHQILKNLLKYKDGKIYPVNPSARSILNLPVFPSLLQIDEHIELVIIAVPVAFIETVIQDCIQKKVKAVVIVTAGFAEVSTQGKALQDKIKQTLQEHDIALLGPNCLGLVAPHQNLNASFANQRLIPGSLGIISQSGAMLTAIFTEMESQMLGCSFAVSLGNKAGISENELLEFAAKDPNTKTIGLYLESFTDLPKFFALSSKISKRKPIILLKGGRTSRGQTASISHTAALATNDVLLKAAAEQAGFVMVDTVEEFLQTLFFLETHRVMPENTMVITNAGGPGVNTVDVGEMKKLTLAEWTAGSKARIEEELPQVHVANPLDVIGDATADRFSFAVRQAQRDPNIDSITVIITQQAVTNVPEVVQSLIQIKGKKPICVALIGGERFAHQRKLLRAAGLIATEYPNEIVEILSVLQRSAKAKYLPETFRPKALMPTSFSAPKESQKFFTDIGKTFELLGQYGIQTPAHSVIEDEKKLERIHLPSYAKTANLALPHKKDVGAIFGLVKTKEDVQNSFEKLKSFGPVLYQQVIEAELELLIGANRDPQFGLYLAVGLGGSWTNVLSDRSYTFLPATQRTLKEKLKQTKAAEALAKLSTKITQSSFDPLHEVVIIMRQVQRLMLDHPEIKEIEINPLMVNSRGLWAADVKIQ
jgi:acyl-CoA synthetase (NDP forming)